MPIESDATNAIVTMPRADYVALVSRIAAAVGLPEEWRTAVADWAATTCQVAYGADAIGGAVCPMDGIAATIIVSPAIKPMRDFMMRYDWAMHRQFGVAENVVRLV
jgi:hypothetical protein